MELLLLFLSATVLKNLCFFPTSLLGGVKAWVATSDKWKTLQNNKTAAAEWDSCQTWSETYRVLRSPQMFFSRSYRWSRHRYRPHSDPRQRRTRSHGHSLLSVTCRQNNKLDNRHSLEDWQHSYHHRLVRRLLISQ